MPFQSESFSLISYPQEMTMLKSFYFILIIHVALPLYTGYAQDDQSGFISIDCGISEGSKYTDTKTGINYVSDDGFVEGGISQKISPEYDADVYNVHLKTLRSFPTNIRNCYTLKPKQGKNNRYLIRVRFMYGDYDTKGRTPQFDLYLGADLWNTVYLPEPSGQYYYEIIHLASSDYIHICLVNTGHGDPFISAIELRLLDITMYQTQFLSLEVVERAVFSSDAIRYQDDKYDRVWYPQSFSSGLKRVQTTNIISSGPLQVPLKVMRTALTNTISIDDGITHTWEATIASNYIAYIHFAEVEILEESEKREFNVYLNDNYWDGPISPSNIITTLKTPSLLTGFSNYTIRMTRTSDSTLPPIMNAIEVYKLKDFKLHQTDDQDAAAIWSTKSSYGIKRNWQGDPCLRKEYVWNGLKCSYEDTTTPRIISLNLSSSGLSGSISDALANLTMIQSLDLSYNSLTGTVPKFLASLNFLKVLNLTGNKFTRPLPEELLAKSKSGSLLLSIDESSDDHKIPCPKGSCKHKKLNIVIIIVIATIAALFVLFFILAIVWAIKRRQRSVTADPNGATADPKGRDELIDPRNQSFTFLDVERITDSFNTVIGKGGFGTVFYGYIGNNQVAVKMLSESSAQGYREFQAEVRLLMSVHHKNITSLVGYCSEGNQKGIIYEYMANGNLGMHLFDGSLNVLSWKKRLEIAYDAAQGLEYMHHGCKPPIVHRDVKCSNILLNENFQAKLADFGLSRAFAAEGATHVSTAICGTPGYLDPEYYTTNRLTEKSDVYSFGVVLLELITGRKAISDDMYIVNWVKSMVAEGNIENLIDPRLHGDYDINTAWKVVELALTCVDSISSKRPTMNDVVTDIKSCLKPEKGFHGVKPNKLDRHMALSLESMQGPNLR